jgi:hypothetical protein
MLVCNVSLRPPRRGIAADVAEATIAADATATGNVVFATLVDDPASVADRVDAYLGDIMLEVASAADTVSAGAALVGAVDEAATATDTQSGTSLVARSGMLDGVYINSDGTSRKANANGVMVNL